MLFFAIYVKTTNGAKVILLEENKIQLDYAFTISPTS